MCTDVIDICMLTHNRARITRLAIEELRYRTLTPHRLIVLDNGSTDNSPKMLHELYNEGMIDVLVLTRKNHGSHWGYNQLLSLVKSSPFYVLTSSDLVPECPVDSVDWLAHLLELADEQKSYAAIACMPHVVVGANCLSTSLCLLRVKAVRKVGGWVDEKRICEQLRVIGHRTGRARNVRCIRLFGAPALGEDAQGHTLGTHQANHQSAEMLVHCYNWKQLGVDWERCY